MKTCEVEKQEDGEQKITDRDLPLSFNEDRHVETIEGLNSINQTWRMKDRVS